MPIPAPRAKHCKSVGFCVFETLGGFARQSQNSGHRRMPRFGAFHRVVLTTSDLNRALIFLGGDSVHRTAFSIDGKTRRAILIQRRVHSTFANGQFDNLHSSANATLRWKDELHSAFRGLSRPVRARTEDWLRRTEPSLRHILVHNRELHGREPSVPPPQHALVQCRATAKFRSDRRAEVGHTPCTRNIRSWSFTSRSVQHMGE